MGDYIRLLRLKHGAKNLLVLIPILFYDVTDAVSILNAFAMCLCFWATASGVYVLNDILDVNRDRLHPVKRNRPIASGVIPIRNAAILACILFLMISIAVWCLFGGFSFGLLSLYVVLNVLYCIGLKNIPIVDVCILAIGFLLRLLCGSLAADVTVSWYIYLAIFGLSFYMILDKRRKELSEGHLEHRSVLQYYSFSVLTSHMASCRIMAIVFYGIWCVSVSYGKSGPGAGLPLTALLLEFLLLKYDSMIQAASDGKDMVAAALSDKGLIVLTILFLGSVGILVRL